MHTFRSVDWDFLLPIMHMQDKTAATDERKMTYFWIFSRLYQSALYCFGPESVQHMEHNTTTLF